MYLPTKLRIFAHLPRQAAPHKGRKCREPAEKLGSPRLGYQEHASATCQCLIPDRVRGKSWRREHSRSGATSSLWWRVTKLQSKSSESILSDKIPSLDIRGGYRVGNFLFYFLHMTLKSDLPWTIHFWKNWSFCALKSWGFLHELLYKGN